jgi:hypothetical protein
MKFVQDYFNAEKYESIFFAALGLVAVLIAIYYYFNIGTPYYKGIAIPFLLIASIQIVVGTIVYFRSPKDIIMVETMLKDAPQKIGTVEIPRMEVVMKNFTIYRYTEISLLVFGLLLFFFCPSDSFWKGIGLGLAIQAGLMLFLDYFAEARGVEYLNVLQGLK